MKLALSLALAVPLAAFVSREVQRLSADPAQEDMRAESLANARQGREMFLRMYERTVMELNHGEVSIHVASAHLLDMAKQLHPLFFDNLGRAEEGNSDEERIARSILSHVRFELESGNPRHLDPGLLERLEGEVEETFR